MPDLNFQVTGVDACASSLAPLLHFRVCITNSPPDETIAAVLLNAQIQFQPAQRGYGAREKEKLVEIFGPPEVWGQTLRNRLWTNSSVTVNAFCGAADAVLAVPCTFDLNVAATKYLSALEDADVSLSFLFSGSVFYRTPDARLQVTRISWDKECAFRMPAQTWRSVMDRHYPNTAWLTLQRDVFDRLCDYKRRGGMPTWEEAIERLLQTATEPNAAPDGNADRAGQLEAIA